MQKNVPNEQTRYYLSGNIFFLIENGDVIVWNYKSHEQFSIEKSYLNEMLHVAEYNIPSNEKIFKELWENGLITDQQERASVWGWDVLSKIFHIGTSNVCSDLTHINEQNFAEYYIEKSKELNDDEYKPFSSKNGELIDLPKPNCELLKRNSFYDVLKNRKTCRNFCSESVSLNNLSTILFMSFGLIHGEWEEFAALDLEQTGIRKSSPSSGGTHAEEVYLVAFNIDGLEQGLYHYRPQDHKLTQLKTGDFENAITEMNYKQYFSKGMAFGIYITSRFSNIWWKYKHSRSYRVAHLDIGHLSQTFLLTATASGLETWLTAAFNDEDVNTFLNIENNDEHVLLFVGAGIGSGQTLPTSFVEYLNNK